MRLLRVRRGVQGLLHVMLVEHGELPTLLGILDRKEARLYLENLRAIVEQVEDFLDKGGECSVCGKRFEYHVSGSNMTCDSFRAKTSNG